MILRRVFDFSSRSLTFHFVALLMIALSTSHGLAMLIFQAEKGQALLTAARADFLNRAASLVQVLEVAPRDQQDMILRASSTTYSRFWLTVSPPPPTPDWRADALERLGRPRSEIAAPQRTGATEEERLADGRRQPIDSAPSSDWLDLPPKDWSLAEPASFVRLDDEIGMGVVTRLNDGRWLNLAVRRPNPEQRYWTSQFIISLALTAASLCLIGVFLVRSITRPMRQLMVAAEAVGRGERVLLSEAGPNDVRGTAVAFNRMQERLECFVRDRTRMLAAIGHDVRTPLTSLRLRAEFIAEDETRTKILATIDELRAITEASLTFAGEEANVEETKIVDLSALVESLCDDLAELGQNVTCADGPRFLCRCRPTALRRAVRNLAENAVRYGGCARLQVFEVESTLHIEVEDDGPGVPDGMLAEVFSPFVRLEESRSAETGGVGLGLAIARSIVRGHGGEVRLQNRATGFTAEIILPKAATEAPGRPSRSARFSWTRVVATLRGPKGRSAAG